MSFLNPQFLFALFAVAIPVLIHFFNLQRPKKFLFPNVRFLREVQQSTSNRLKLKHILIMLARVLVVTFLVLAFAQPFWNLSADADKKGKALADIYVDNSYSMLVDREEGKAFDQALNSALRIPDVYPTSTRYEVITNDFEGKDVVKRSRDSYSERLSEVRFSPASRKASEVVSRSARQQANSDADRKHVYWFSDFQRSSFDQNAIKLDSNVQYYLVPLGTESIHNVFVDTAWMSSPVIRENENTELKCRLMNSGNTPVKELTVKLFVDGIQLNAQNISLEPDASAELSFRFAVQGKGYKRAEIRFDDQPVNFDNQYFLTFRVSPVVKVLHLFESNPVLGRVYAGEPMFDLVSRPVGDFNYAQIEQSNLVVLEGLTTIPDALKEPLRDFCNKGGSVAVVPSYASKQDSYASFLSAFGISGILRETPDTSKRVASQLNVPDFNHPFFSDFFERKDGRLLMPFSFAALSWVSRGEALLRYRDGKAFLTKTNTGKGSVYLLAGGLDEKYSDFARHSLLVPIFYKIAFWSLSAREPLNYTFNESTADLRIDFAGTKNFELVNGDRRFIPGQRLVGGHLFLDIPDEALNPGFYELYYADSLVKVLAFNHGKEESQMKFLSDDELRTFASGYKNVRVLEPGTSDTFANSLKTQSIGLPLWKYCILLCLLFLMAETLLIRYFRQKGPVVVESVKTF